MQTKFVRQLVTVSTLLILYISAYLTGQPFATKPLFAANIVVDSLDDDVDPIDGNCTFREAIMSANGTPTDPTSCGTGDTGSVDTILFSVSGTIAVVGVQLPEITDGLLIIDGLDAPNSPSCGPTRNLEISIDGSGTSETTGLNLLNVSDVTIRGLNVHSFEENGIQISGSSNVMIQCNHIGTDITGTAANANGKNGILINEDSRDVTIGTESNGINDEHEFNVISGNNSAGTSGIFITDNSDDNIVAGNRIGTDITGMVDVGNGGVGIQIRNASSGNRIGTDANGSSDELERNIISGNGSHGVSISDAGTDTNIVAGNYIGLAIDGTTQLQNDASGVNITNGAAENLVGGVTEPSRNYLSGNDDSGVQVTTGRGLFDGGTYTADNIVRGNTIGLNTDADPMGNGNQGIYVQLTVNTEVISNTVMENDLRGIYIVGAEATISENRIVNNRRSGIEVTFEEGSSYSAEDEASTPDDIISSVDIFNNIIGGNCIVSNPCAGIYGNDDSVDPDNRDNGATVAAANDIQTNNGDPDVTQYWYGSVELTNQNIILSGSPLVESNNGGTTYTLSEPVVAGASLSGSTLHGPADPINSASTFATTDIRTWEFIQEFEIDENGVPATYSPHTVTTIPYSFDADATTNPTDTGAGFIGEGITSTLHPTYTTANSSFALTRYQILESSVPYVTLAATPSVIEGNTATVTLTVNVVQTVNVTVTVAFADGTATTPDDYTPTAITVVIPAGSRTATIPVNTTSDTSDELDETYTASIVDVVNAADDSETQTTTILDDDEPAVPDALPEVTLSGTQFVDEGSNAPITVNLNITSTEDVTVTLLFTDDTADAATDYTPPANLAVVIPAGSTSSTISVPTTPDTTDESDESFLVDIVSVTNATDASAQQTVTILDDDDAPPIPGLPTTTVTTSMPIVEEGISAVLTVTIDTVLAELVTFTVNYQDGTAIRGIDYIGTLVTVEMPAGDTETTAVIPTIDDTIVEEGETFRVTIDSDVEMNFIDPSVTITILDNDVLTPPDTLPEVSLNGTQSVNEGTNAPVTVNLSTTSTDDVIVTLRLTDDTATAGDDYTIPANLTVVIPAGSMSNTVSVPTTPDSTDEPDETFLVDIISVTNATNASTQQMVTILDDDMPFIPGLPTATITTSMPMVDESSSATIVVTIDTVLEELVTFTVGYHDETTIRDVDYIGTLVTVEMPAGDTETSATIPLIDDSLDEENETFRVSIDSDVEMNFIDSSVMFTIVDNDEPTPSTPSTPSTPTVALAATPLVIEGNTVIITAALNMTSTEEVIVTIAYVNRTTSDNDISPTTTTIVIPAGSLEASIQLSTVIDTVTEGFEDFSVEIVNVVNGDDGSTPQAVVINDPAPVDDDTRTPSALDEVEEPTSPENARRQEPTIFLPLYSSGW